MCYCRTSRFLVGLTLVCFSIAVRAADVRLAVVSADPQCNTAADLLTAEFSQSRFGLVLLERAEVERIRREQNLTARNA